jgi:hypothetical protein
MSTAALGGSWSMSILRALHRRVHQPGPAAGDERVAERRDAAREVAGRRVVRRARTEARRSEERDARPDEVQRPEAADELPRDARDAQELLRPRVAPGEQARFARRLAREHLERLGCRRHRKVPLGLRAAGPHADRFGM